MQYDIYTDGSYRELRGYGAYYAGAAVIKETNSDNVVVTLTKVGNDELLPMRNVAGEILAVMMAMEHCLNVLKLTQDDEVRIFYDYQGIENWTKRKGEPNYWRSKNPLTQGYRDYINTIVRPVFKVTFHHVPAHSGIAGNELVDRLAKEAIIKHVNILEEHK